MIKGCHKQIVFLKNTGSPIFDEAYFILKPQAYNKKESDVILEATRIINDLNGSQPKKQERKRVVSSVAYLILGTVLGVTGAMLINLFI